MKTKLHLFIIASLLTISGFSQSSEKIKGSRNVTTQITEIDAFNRLIIGGNFKINLKQGERPSVIINTDDNLHDVIKFNVQDSSLNFKTSKKITSSKVMEITVVFKDSLNIIELKEDAELTSTSAIKVTDLMLKLKESSEAYLTLETEKFNFISEGKTKAELNVTTKESTINMSDNSDLKALINADKIIIDMLQRADAKLEGDASELIIKLDNNSVLKAEKLASKNCNLIAEGKADAHLNVSKNLIIEASGTTETYIYGEPKIELKKFEDEAVLRKK